MFYRFLNGFNKDVTLTEQLSMTVGSNRLQNNFKHISSHCISVFLIFSQQITHTCDVMFKHVHNSMLHLYVYALHDRPRY